MHNKTTSALDFLTEKEKAAVQMFIENETMRDAVKKLLLDQIFNQGVQPKGVPTLQLRNWIFGLDATGKMTDDNFGRAVRVHTEALVVLEQAYDKMFDLVPAPEIEPKANPAI